MQKFQASYEDAAKSEKAARELGWDGQDGGLLDTLNGCAPKTHKTFATRAEAEAWLLAEINASKSLFGCGDIDVLEQPKRRCRYCNCKGWLTRASYIYDDEGLAEERTDLPEECAN